MKIRKIIRTVLIGIVDGWDAPHEFDCSTPFKNDKDLEKVYERVVNLAQVTRLAYEVYKSGGTINHLSAMPNLYLDKILTTEEVSKIIQKNHYNKALQN